ISVIGGGSWATALVKILSESNEQVGWWMRDQESVDYIKTHQHNPKYVTSVELPMDRIELSTDMDYIVEKSDYLIFAIPSAFLKASLTHLTIPLHNKIIFS